MQKRDNSKYYILGILIAVIVLLIFFNSLGWLTPVKNILFRVTTPVMRSFYFLGNKISSTVSIAVNLKNLIKENAELKKENQNLVLKTAQIAEIEQENKTLRLQLQLAPPLKSKIIQANIIGFDPGNLGQYFMINKGVEAGVKINQGVIFAGGFLVGRVAEVSDRVSKVMELTDSQSSVFVRTLDTRVDGVVKGDHGVSLILDMVPPEKELENNETIVSSGLDGFIPRGLVIGQIEMKVSTENEVFQRFKIKPAVDCREIESVFVVLGNE